MLIIEKRKLIIVLILSFVLISASSVWAYNVGIKHGLKSGSELVLFFGFIGAGLQLILSISIILYAEKKRGDFYMLLETIKSTGMLSEKKAKKLGTAGLDLQKALEAAHNITMQKSLKIAGLNGLVKILIEMTDSPVLLVNLAGEIMEASPKAQTEIGNKQGAMLSDVFPDLDVRAAFKKAGATRQSVEQGDKIVFVPVFSTIGDITYFLVDISKQDLISKVMDTFKSFSKEDTEKKQRLRFFKIIQK